MNRSMILMVAVLALFVSPLAAAEPAPAPDTDENVTAAVSEPSEAVSEKEVTKIGELDLEEQAASCNCRDLCRNDLICVLLYGPGSQCLPQPPCGCRECSGATQ